VRSARAAARRRARATARPGPARGECRWPRTPQIIIPADDASQLQEIYDRWICKFERPRLKALRDLKRRLEDGGKD
jgi:hypothetical protein